MEVITDLLASLGYYGIFLVLLSGIFGPPIPDEIFLIMIGYWTFEGAFAFLPSLALVTTGSLGGTAVNYLVGRCCGYSAKVIKMEISPRLASRLLEARDLVKRFGPGIVTGCYFLPGLRHWAPLVAGMLKAHPARVGFWAGVGALLWSSAYLGLGYTLARKGLALPTSLDPGCHWVIIGIALVLLAVWLARRKWERDKSAEIPPISDP
jgi:membrane protein DedA with SNARE-associated domain